jgi:hypothetical protein
MTTTRSVPTTINQHPRIKEHAARRQALEEEFLAEKLRHELLLGERQELSPEKVRSMVRVGAVKAATVEDQIKKLDQEIATKAALVERLERGLGKSDVELRRIRAEVQAAQKAEAEAVVRTTLEAMGPHLLELRRLDATLQGLRSQQPLMHLPIVVHAMLHSYFDRFKAEAKKFGARVDD